MYRWRINKYNIPKSYLFNMWNTQIYVYCYDCIHCPYRGVYRNLCGIRLHYLYSVFYVERQTLVEHELCCKKFNQNVQCLGFFVWKLNFLHRWYCSINTIYKHCQGIQKNVFVPVKTGTKSSTETHYFSSFYRSYLRIFFYQYQHQSFGLSPYSTILLNDPI